MTIFNRLLNLYGSGDSIKTPLEDFCTECLAGILNNSQKLRNEFVTEVLKIQSNEDFKLQTQKRYLDGQVNIVDLVFKSPSVICFLEMKVKSFEGPNQLKRYEEILLKQFSDDYDVYLRYCSQYHDHKHKFFEKSIFYQFRWAHIAAFFQQKAFKNRLINEFYQFLKDMNMAGNERFTHEDLIGLKSFDEILQKISEVFSLVRETLENSFGSANEKNNQNEINGKNRISLKSDNILGEGWSEAIVYFRFRGDRKESGPQIVVQMWLSKDNTKYEEFEKAALKFDSENFDTTTDYEGGYLKYSVPLANLLETENQFSEIKNWIEEKINKLSEFKHESKLEWN